MKRLVACTLVALTWASSAAAAPQPWMFDFDPNISANPAYVNQHMNVLKAGLPGLPPKDIVELTSKQTKLYFYQDVIDNLILARDSGPGFAPTVQRTPKHCVEHFAYSRPSLLLDAPPLFCDAHENAALAAFDGLNNKTCGYVEFPETYVYDHKPLGLILPTTTTDLDLLIAILGEALTQIRYPQNLIPPTFLPRARKILAKVRYQKLKTELAQRKQGYQKALVDLKAQSHCYKPAALATFTATANKLLAELVAVEKDLDALYQAGIVQAVKDRKAIEAQGRKREDLPYPALSDRDRELLAFYLGGIAWRVRGEGLIAEKKVPLGLALTFVAPPYQIIGDIAGGKDGAGVGFPIYVDENAGYYKWYDMGTDPGGNDKYADLVQMTERGKRATGLVTPVLANRGYDTRYLVAGGLMMGPCYYYIWEELPKFTLGLPCNPKPGAPYPPNTPSCLGPPDYCQFLEWPTATGEFCTGGALALGLVKTLLNGKPGKACTPFCFGKPCGADDTCGGTCGTCPDGGPGPSPDGSVAPQRDGGSQPKQDGGVAPGKDSGSSTSDLSGIPGKDGGAQPQNDSASGGCSVGATPQSPLAVMLLLMMAMAMVVRRR